MGRLDDINKRMNAATKGDWVYNPVRDTHDFCIHTVDAHEEYKQIADVCGVVGSSEWIWLSDEDGEFIANAKSDIDFLLHEVERLNCCLRESAAEVSDCVSQAESDKGNPSFIRLETLIDRLKTLVEESKGDL